tara:strand:- start:325 stop:510 length:186 start_codon:yes stop_codon:yes gene_type:complete
MTTIETLRTENTKLQTLISKLLKEVTKVMKTNLNGAKLIFARIEELDAKRLENNRVIISLQ